MFSVGSIALIVLLLLSGCPGCDPVVPDKPPVIDPSTGGAPAPAPTATPCEQMCALRASRGCDGAGPGCPNTCERFENEGKTAPALAENPACQLNAADCAAMDACRGGK